VLIVLVCSSFDCFVNYCTIKEKRYISLTIAVKQYNVV